MDGTVVIVDVVVAVTTADADAPAAAVPTAAAARISVPVPDVRHTGKASAMAIGRALTMQPGAIRDAAALHPAQPEDLVQLSPKAAAAVITNMN